MATNERRKERRNDLSIRIKINRLDKTSNEQILVDVLDVSKAGIGFISDTELESGAIYEADITIWTGDTIHAFIEIVRVSAQEGGGIYGGIFVGMPESDWSRIRVYETYQEFGDKNS